jgi:hypothetical protein
LQELADEVQEEIEKLLPHQTWVHPSTLPPPGSFSFEAMQITLYHETEHFRPHEDGFPWPLAREKEFQRRATVLMYLNDVPEGGCTRFTHLDLAVQPKRGRALLFFPSFIDGRPDLRTLHEAEDAVDVKWVVQQWCTGGVKGRRPVSQAQQPVYRASVERVLKGLPKKAGTPAARASKGLRNTLPLGEHGKAVAAKSGEEGEEDDEERRLEAFEEMISPSRGGVRNKGRR